MRKIALIALSLMLVFTAASCAKKASPVRPGADTGAYDLDEAFKRANALIDKKQYDAARRELELIKGRDTGMKYAPLAHLRVADTYIMEKEYDPAIVEYRKFIEFYPNHKYASYAQFQIGIIYFDQIEDAERGSDAAARALEEFEKLNQLYPRNPYRESLKFYMEKCRDILSEHGFIVASFYFKKKAYEAAINRYLEVLDEYPDFKKKEETYYRLALSYARMGQAETARRYLNRLKTEYPDSKFAEKAEKEIAKSGEKG
jgi:outer membrane protein assembly factor BamD